MGESQDTSAQKKSGELFFNQGSYCGWGQNFGTLPYGEAACRSLHETSEGIYLQEIKHRDTRYPL